MQIQNPNHDSCCCRSCAWEFRPVIDPEQNTVADYAYCSYPMSRLPVAYQREPAIEAMPPCVYTVSCPCWKSKSAKASDG